MSDMTIALLGQPNSGKSTLFNALTGSRQHVGNWPGKTVEQKEGYFIKDSKKYKIIDLPGTYSLSANSEEEIITREYIASGKADFVYILADASQLERSLFMLADYVGINIPTILILNMMDVAKSQKKIINSEAISKKLGIQVVPMSAADTKNYGTFFKAMEKAEKRSALLDAEELLSIYNENMGNDYKQIVSMLPKDGVGKYSSMWLATKLLEKDEPAMEIVKSSVNANVVNKIENILKKVQNGSLLTGDCKFKWIDSILKENVKSEKKSNNKISKFDNIVTSRVWGKALAVGVIILGIILSLVIAMPIMSGAQYIFKVITPIVKGGLAAIETPQIIISLNGNIQNSIIYKIGIFIEPVTMWFGLRWQLFIAFLASAMGKESALGVLSSLFNSSTSMNGVWGAMFDGQAANSAVGLSNTLLNTVSKAEALAFIYAFFFNIPCVITIASTFQESHSIKWTARIAMYYIIGALIMSTIAYPVGRLIF